MSTEILFVVCHKPYEGHSKHVEEDVLITSELNLLAHMQSGMYRGKLTLDVTLNTPSQKGKNGGASIKLWEDFSSAVIGKVVRVNGASIFKHSQNLKLETP
ncbi:hypothetical protein ATANTOWER_008176 [Ataeniobius toweri]|uniref:Uncharacterized protein n=1 Tax=Ataeniobius toweri TaxID=208326 RepID=A0ABU7BNE6_9TELE|nr:hypothetical protein [Ataeniobius toweri]